MQSAVGRSRRRPQSAGAVSGRPLVAKRPPPLCRNAPSGSRRSLPSLAPGGPPCEEKRRSPEGNSNPGPTAGPWTPQPRPAHQAWLPPTPGQAIYESQAPLILRIYVDTHSQQIPVYNRIHNLTERDAGHVTQKDKAPGYPDLSRHPKLCPLSSQPHPCGHKPTSSKPALQDLPPLPFAHSLSPNQTFLWLCPQGLTPYSLGRSEVHNPASAWWRWETALPVNRSARLHNFYPQCVLYFYSN